MLGKHSATELQFCVFKVYLGKQPLHLVHKEEYHCHDTFTVLGMEAWAWDEPRTCVESSLALSARSIEGHHLLRWFLMEETVLACPNCFLHGR